MLDLLCVGHGSEEIAQELAVSEQTVDSHLKSVRRKLALRFVFSVDR